MYSDCRFVLEIVYMNRILRQRRQIWRYYRRINTAKSEVTRWEKISKWGRAYSYDDFRSDYGPCHILEARILDLQARDLVFEHIYKYC